MLKTADYALHGKDEGKTVRLRELPAMVADRAARECLRAIDADVAGGVVALTLRHVSEVRALGPRGLDLLMPFVKGELLDEQGEPIAAFNVRKHLRDWRNVAALQDAALLLHAGFVVGREALDIPITLQAQAIMRGSGTEDVAVKFCSPHIAAALDAGMCSFVEAETVLSTEDIYSIVEILNVRALREFHDSQRASR